MLEETGFQGHEREFLRDTSVFLSMGYNIPEAVKLENAMYSWGRGLLTLYVTKIASAV